ncbi:hypothetical protein A9Q94_13040 [Rhodobacterales bacterium 56_14_T64]|nr:hypothetical protein A9Q94_13040 [Rhodobacterales bacterium 56_14_T64]
MSGQVITGTLAADTINVNDENHTINSGSGNNQVTAGNGDNQIDAGRGNDKVSVGHGHNSIRVGDGTNRVLAGDGDNSIQSGKGSDQITVGRGSNVITSSGGNNRIIGSDGNTQITTGDGKDDIRLGHGDNTIAAGDGVNRGTAGDGSNAIETGVGADRITLGNGDNKIDAGAGNNQITVGDGINEVITGDGNDRITAGNDANEIDAGHGTNKIVAGDGDNQIATGKDKDDIRLGDGHNTIDAGAGDNKISAGGGDNNVSSGSGKDDIRLGNGNNWISAGNGSNKITVGDGHNTIVTGDGSDAIIVGDGTNTINVGHGINRVTAGLGDNVITSGDGKNEVQAGNGNNIIKSGSGGNRITVGDGFNEIETGDGADAIRAGQGDNQISAGDGKNAITVGDGYNTIETGSGDDKISVGDGNNVITAGEGRNRVQAGDGENQIHSGTGIDDIRLGDGNNDIWSEGGNNKISSGDGFNFIVTHGGHDNIKVGDGVNQILAGDGNNRIDAGTGENDITTGDGNDYIRVKGHKNTIDAGDGRNVIFSGDGDNDIKTGVGNDTIKLGDGTNQIKDDGGANRISAGDGVVDIQTTDGKDDIRIGDGYGTISTGDGDKKISAGDGTMSIFAGHGKNTISVGDGDNEVHLGDGNNRITVGDGQKFIFVGDGNNSIRAGDGPSQITTGNGNNTVSIGDGYGEIVTGDGRDDIRVGDGDTEIDAGADNDKIRTGDGNNTVYGGDGNDTITTGDGDDQIWGGQGNDKISAGDGYDIAYYAGSFTDYVLERSSSRIEITSVNSQVSDAGSDQLSGFEAIYFQGDGVLLDTTTETETTLVDDHVTSLGNGPVTFSLSSLLDNDENLGDLPPVFAVSEYSSSGIRVTYDGENITYNPEDVLSHLGRGEVFEDSFSYTVTNPFGETFDAEVTVSLSGINEGPVAEDDHLPASDALPASVTFGALTSVNIIKSGYQTDPSIARLTDGKHIVVWETDYGNGTGHDDVKARILNADGSATGQEFLINQHTAGFQGHAEVTALANGGFVVTWMSSDRSSDDQYSINARIFNANGKAVSSEINVELENIAKELEPSITALDGGGFVVSWYGYSSGGSGWDVSAAIFDDRGHKIVDDFVVSESADSTQQDIDITSLPDGGFIATWYSYENPNASGADIKARIFDANGNVTVDEFLVNQATNGLQGHPTVAVRDDESFVVSWYTQADGYDLSARVFNSDGTAATEEFIVNGNESAHSRQPAVTWLEDGRFVVAWIDGNIEGFDLKARVFNSDGTESIAEFLVSPGVVNGFEIAAQDGGDFIITWSVEGEINSQVFETTAGGPPNASEDEVFEIKVADFLANDSDIDGDTLGFSLDAGTSAFGASITYDPATGTLIYDPTASVEIQALNDGETLNDSFTYTVSDGHGGTDQATVTLVVDGADGVGDPVATVVANYDHFGPNGSADDDLVGGSNIQIVDPMGQVYSQPTIAGHDDGSFVTVWTTQGLRADGSTGILMQGRMSDAAGQHTTDIFVISEHGGGETNVTMLQSGGFMVTHTAYYGPPTEPDGYDLPGQIAQIFSADGTPTSDEFWVSDGGSTLTTAVSSLTELSNGNIAVARYTMDYDYYDEQTLEVAIFTPEGQQVGDTISFDTNIFGLHNDISIEALPDGGFLATWATIDPAINPDKSVIKAARFDNDGHVTQPEFTVSSTHDQDLWGHSLAVREDGSFVVVWASRGYSTLEDVYLRASVFNADGSIAGEEFVIDAATWRLVGDFPSDVTFLPNGQFAVTWRGINEDGVGEARLFVQLFNDDGTAATDQVLVRDDVSSDFPRPPSIVVLDDDSFAVIWHDASSRNQSDGSIEGRVFDFNGEETGTSFASEDEVTSFDVSDLLDNDAFSNPDELIFALSAASSTNGAALSYDADTGTVTYDPTAAADIQALNDGQILEDSFIYTISDGNGGTDQATVTIVVGGADEAASLAAEMELALPVTDDFWG